MGLLDTMPAYEKFIEVTQTVEGVKEVTRKKDGKTYKIAVFRLPDGQELNLFFWALKEENNKIYCLKHHFERQLEEVDARRKGLRP